LDNEINVVSNSPLKRFKTGNLNFAKEKEERKIK